MFPEANTHGWPRTSVLLDCYGSRMKEYLKAQESSGVLVIVLHGTSVTVGSFYLFCDTRIINPVQTNLSHLSSSWSTRTPLPSIGRCVSPRILPQASRLTRLQDFGHVSFYQRVHVDDYLNTF